MFRAIMFSALHSLVIDVADFEVGVRDYARLLGIAPRRAESSGAGGTGGTRSALFPLANTLLELRDGAAPSGDSGREQAAGFGLAGFRLACDVDDPQSLLGARGVGCSAARQQEARVEGQRAPRRWLSHRVDPGSSRGLAIELVREATRVGNGLPGGSGVSSLDPAESSEIDPRARIRGLDHVVVLSPDVEATRAFYAEGLGLRLALDRSFEARGVRLLFFRIGGTTIEIGTRLGVEARPDLPDRFGGLAWQVVELEAIRSRLVADGFDVSGIREGHKPGTRVCSVRDPVHRVPTLLIEPVSRREAD